MVSEKVDLYVPPFSAATDSEATVTDTLYRRTPLAELPLDVRLGYGLMPPGGVVWLLPGEMLVCLMRESKKCGW